MMNPPSDKTTLLFKPFLRLKKAKRNTLTENQYIKMVDNCISSFHGQGKLSPNRKMWKYSSIIVYIYYEIDSDLLFEKFTKSFKVTTKNKDEFLKQFLSSFKAPFTDKKKTEIIRVFNLVYEDINAESKILEIYNGVKDFVNDPEEMFAAIEIMLINKTANHSDIDNELPSKKGGCNMTFKSIEILKVSNLDPVFNRMLSVVEQYFVEEQSNANPLWVSLTHHYDHKNKNPPITVESVSDVYAEILKTDYGHLIEPEDVIELSSEYFSHEIDFFLEEDSGKKSLYKLLSHMENTKINHNLTDLNKSLSSEAPIRKRRL